MPDTSSRIDYYPTHEYQGFHLRPGHPYPFGATILSGGVNFSVFSSHATSCTLVLFDKGEPLPRVEIPFPDSFRIGNVWCMVVFDLDCESVEYGYRMDGPFEPAEGHRFDPTKILLDPYAKTVSGREIWGQDPDWQQPFPHRGRLVFEDFDWEDDRPLERPMEELVIYEMHVRSFTRHPSALVKHPGTFAGLLEKIPYLKELGINCIEMMPVYEFDEFENSRKSPTTGETLYNYWGYSTVGFFSPKAGYAATGRWGMQVDELKNVVKEIHKAGIEVILDVVFNHTAEGNEHGPTISFRGLDNKTYYMLTPEGYYFNFSGCGNTLNCNHPIVRSIVLDCLRYWAAEFHIDGFRFDLAAILGRDPWGAPLPNPPLLESLAFDPVLAKCKLIAEAWDAGGLYQVGTFPAYGRWAEWNGKYRDDVRRFVKGDPGLAGALATRLQGSPDLYGWNGRGPTASINFLTCHDGFTLLDLFSYNEKHNEKNGEENRDGANDNHSWNCGREGATEDPPVQALRRQMIKTALSILLTSRGVPMLWMGDEMGRTQEGNNNAYCLDDPTNWLDWNLTEQNRDLLRFVQLLLRHRKAHPLLRSKKHPCFHRGGFEEYPEISFHGQAPWQPDWSEESRRLACLWSGRDRQDAPAFLYFAVNAHWEGAWFALPRIPRCWHVAINTGMPAPEDIFAPGEEVLLSDQSGVFLSPRSAMFIIGK